MGPAARGQPSAITPAHTSGLGAKASSSLLLDWVTLTATC